MKLLKQLYCISSPSKQEHEMIRFVTDRLQSASIPYMVDNYGNIFATKGESDTYPCVVCHIDEVHSARDKYFEAVDFRKEILFGYNRRKRRLQGTGADDKNGIWICLKCIENTPVIKCAFFTGEETGCTGSSQCDLAFFNNCRFVVECDRKGGGDMVTSIGNLPLCSKTFIRDCDPQLYGYHPSTGMTTDIYTLKNRGLPVSCVNLSCGYYNPHSNEEYTDIEELRNCYRFVRYIIENCIGVYKHRPKPSKHRYGGYHEVFRFWE